MARMVPLLLSIIVWAGCSGPPSGEASAAAAPAAAAPAPAPAPQGATGPSGGAQTGAAPQTGLPDDLRVTSHIAPQIPGSEVADRYTHLFYDGELAKLFAKFSDEMKTDVPLAQLEQNHAKFVAQFGNEATVVHRESKEEDGYRAFVRWSRFEKYDGVIGIQWILREDDSIAGFYVRSAQPQE